MGRFLRFDTPEEAKAFTERARKVVEAVASLKKEREIPTEHEEQVKLFQWCEVLTHQVLELKWIYAIPNGGLRNKTVAVKLKAEGVKSGVPDICLPVARKDYHGLYIEMKRQKDSQVSDNQNTWIDSLIKEGYCVKVCKGYEPAKNIIMWYLDINF